MSTAKWPYPKGRTAHAHAHATFEEITASQMPAARQIAEPLVDPLSAAPPFQPRPVVPAKAASPPARKLNIQWLTLAVAAIAVVEGLFIGGLLYARRATALPASGTITIESAQPGLELRAAVVVVRGHRTGHSRQDKRAQSGDGEYRGDDAKRGQVSVAHNGPPLVKANA